MSVMREMSVPNQRGSGRISLFAWLGIGTCAGSGFVALVDAIVRWRITSLAVGIGFFCAMACFMALSRFPLDRRRDRMIMIALGSFVAAVSFLTWSAAELFLPR